MSVPGARGGQRGYPLELELRMVVCCPVEVKPGSPTRATSALNHGVITTAPRVIFFLKIYLLVILVMYTVSCLHVSLPARRGHQISLQMVVSHHVVAGN